MPEVKGTIAIQWTTEPWYVPVMESLERGCKALGHSTIRWHCRAQIPRGIEALIWWGCNIDADLLRRGQATGAKILWLERGWTIDRNICFQLDSRGVGGRASWVDDKLDWAPAGRLPLTDNRPLLVVLRYEKESRQTDFVWELSPYFRNNVAWLQFLKKTSSLPLVFRPHPETTKGANLPVMRLARAHGCIWDTSPDFMQAVRQARAVAVLDSTAGVWAMELGLPVLCYGRQVYRHPYAVYCLDADAGKTEYVMSRLAAGVCDLDRGAVAAMVQKIRDRQWYAKDESSFPERLQREFGL